MSAVQQGRPLVSRELLWNSKHPTDSSVRLKTRATLYLFDR